MSQIKAKTGKVFQQKSHDIRALPTFAGGNENKEIIIVNFTFIRNCSTQSLKIDLIMNTEGQGPVIAQGKETGTPFSASGNTLVIHEWKGSGPPYLHVHNEDDEAWHVLEGALVFRFADKEVRAVSGMTVFVPAGVSHTYMSEPGSRYLMILTPRLDALIRALQSAPMAQHAAIMEQHKSRIC